MDSHLWSTENLDSILSYDLIQIQSSTEELNNLNTRVTYNFDPLETFSGTDLTDDPENFINLDDVPLTTQESDNINGVYRYLKKCTESFNPIEPNNTEYNSRNDDEQLAMIRINNESLSVVRSNTEKSSKSTIALSDSVAVTNSKQLQLIYPLEETYRPRYKSDYFPQNGPVRRPRYIADNASNHFITLQLPTDYQYNLQNMYIRVALITTFIEDHGHYYSPYKFQIDHNDIHISDENPIYIKVETNQEDKFIMRLQLVLIKSKLDQLHYVQPLKPFSDTITHIQNIIHEDRLSPKDLINKYQLDKSQIAFTLCIKLPDGTYKPNTETTIISSILTEIPTPKKLNELTPTSLDNSTQNVYCPNCTHCFNPHTLSRSNDRNEHKPNNKTSRSSTKTSIQNRTNKKKKNA